MGDEGMRRRFEDYGRCNLDATVSVDEGMVDHGPVGPWAWMVDGWMDGKGGVGNA